MDLSSDSNEEIDNEKDEDLVENPDESDNIEENEKEENENEHVPKKKLKIVILFMKFG